MENLQKTLSNDETGDGLWVLHETNGSHGQEEVFQNLIRDAISDKWTSANNFTHAMDYLKAAYSSAFNKGDPYQGTLGLYSKLYYMKDAT